MFRFTAKLRGDFPSTLCPQRCIASPTVSIPHQSGTFATIHEATWTHQYHPESIVYIEDSLLVLHILWVLTNVSWHVSTIIHNDKCIMVCNVIQNSFTALETLCALLIHGSLPSRPWQPVIFYCLHSFASFRMSFTWNPSICNLFRLASFTK